jgi:hypothetical protein
MPISTVIGPLMDQVVVLLIGLPPSAPNPWSAQIRPNTATINPTANVTTKVLLISGSYAPDLVATKRQNGYCGYCGRSSTRHPPLPAPTASCGAGSDWLKYLLTAEDSHGHCCGGSVQELFEDPPNL